MKLKPYVSFSTLVLLLAGLFHYYSFAGTSSRPPEQPVSGPGGAEYRHTEVTKSVYGEGNNQYWVFEPAGPIPESAPLIVFNHGWGAMNPRVYGAWIEHIVRRGNIVVYPRYQAEWRHPPGEITANAIQAVKDALARLQKGGHVRPELDKVAIVGHSAGGQITANMAALAKSARLPEPKAIMCVQPGKSWSRSQRIVIPLEDLSKISKSILLLTVVGDKDKVARDIDAKRIFNETPQIPLANKDYVIIVSDDHGRPALTANHFAPCAPDEDYDSGEERKKGGDLPRARLRQRFRQRLESRLGKRRELDNNGFPDLEAGSLSTTALDYYGLWKLFDGLTEAAFYGKNRKYALGNTPQQHFMGKWSDGTPVKELVVTDTP